MKQDDNRELEDMIMLTALYLIQDRTRKVSDMETDFLADLTFKLQETYDKQVGTVH
tara:strand:- start:284 stop:451 length:168 start_codon:yes stop_codon:yes gene_type:complete